MTTALIMPTAARRHPAMKTRFRFRLITGEKEKHNFNLVQSPTGTQVRQGVLSCKKNTLSFSYLGSRSFLRLSLGAEDPGKWSGSQSEWQPLSFGGDVGDRLMWSWGIPVSSWCRGSLPHISALNSWCTPECNRTRCHYISTHAAVCPKIYKEYIYGISSLTGTFWDRLVGLLWTKYTRRYTGNS